MELKDFVQEGFERCAASYDRALTNLSDEEWYWQPNDQANSIAFIIWHVSRVEDRWLQMFAQGIEQLWIREDWSTRLGITGDDTGLGWSAEQVASIPRRQAALSLEYMKAVEASTFAYIDRIAEEGFDFIPDRTPFPEFQKGSKFFEGYTVGQMFRQLMGEKTTHLGHVTFLRGLQRGLNK